MARNVYIWQQKAWPKFIWDDAKILNHLSLARKIQGKIIALASDVGLETQAQIFVEDALKTSAIEGEKLELESIRSSVAKRLGLSAAGLSTKQINVEGVVDMLVDATHNYSAPLTVVRLKGWQAGLFPSGHSGIHKIIVGEWREPGEPMRVVSGKMGKEKVHFEAPPAENVPTEMKRFITWFNSNTKVDGLVRAAIAHFWFVTIHPFEDGNGRIARAITDLALAEDESLAKRLYSLSSQINHDRDDYYKILEKSQKGHLDITDWIIWFLNTFVRAIERSQILIDKAIFIGNYWKVHAHIDLNQRQKKVIQKMLEYEPSGFVGGMTNKKYVSLTRVSAASAKRDLGDLEEKELIKRSNSKGRSISYFLILNSRK